LSRNPAPVGSLVARSPSSKELFNSLGLKADMAIPKFDVCFAPVSGHRWTHGYQIKTNTMTMVFSGKFGI